MYCHPHFELIHRYLRIVTKLCVHQIELGRYIISILQIKELREINELRLTRVGIRQWSNRNAKLFCLYLFTFCLLFGNLKAKKGASLSNLWRSIVSNSYLCLSYLASVLTFLWWWHVAKLFLSWPSLMWSMCCQIDYFGFQKQLRRFRVILYYGWHSSTVVVSLATSQRLYGGPGWENLVTEDTGTRA